MMAGHPFPFFDFYPANLQAAEGFFRFEEKILKPFGGKSPDGMILHDGEALVSRTFFKAGGGRIKQFEKICEMLLTLKRSNPVYWT
ncbi:MAG: hypothetical protein FWG93_01080 [Oscillospiraceae bacterium]|nr:hypothetical protein [Oscillospiraceae bacterium]